MIRILVLMLLVSCNEPQKPKIEREHNFAPRGVSRFYDDENNVVCYTMYGESISCVRKQ